MSTYTTTASIPGGSTAALNTFIEEICNALFTECGLTQTADTGQCWTPNTATATWSSSVNTSFGYVIGEFNDALNTDYPVYIRFDFGNGAVDTNPQVWLTVGTSTNGSGTIGGTSMTKGAALSGATPSSPSTNYPSYFVYNSTYGVLGMSYKVGGSNASGDTGLAFGGFYLYRGSTSAGAENSDAVTLIYNNSPNGDTSSTGADPLFQSLVYALSAIRPTSVENSNLAWIQPFADEPSNATNGGYYVYPFLYANPGPAISAVLGLVNNADVNVGSSFSASLLGDTPITMLNVGGAFGTSTIGGRAASGLSQASVTLLGSGISTGWGIAFLWE